MRKRLRQNLLNILPKETLENINNPYDVIGDKGVARLTKIPRKQTEYSIDQTHLTKPRVKRQEDFEV